MGHQKQQKTRNAKRTLSTKKVLYVIFPGEGVAIQVPMKKGQTRYWKILQTYSIEGIEKKILSETAPNQGFQTCPTSTL